MSSNVLRGLLLLLTISPAFVCAAAEKTPDKPLTEEEKKQAEEERKKKIPALKYDVWCVFSELSGRAPREENPESSHSRVNSIDLEGYGRRGKWAHVVLDLKNTTELKKKIIYEGYASIVFNQVQPGGSAEIPYSTTYRQPFKVGPESENQYHFSILCPDYGWESNVGIRIETSMGSSYSRAFTLRDLDQAREELIVVVSDTPGSFKYLGPQRNRKDVDMTNEDLSKPAGRQVATVVPSELPERWQDLSLASLIIIDGPPSEPLNPAQWDALKTYARSGGRVLIMAGRDPARLKGAVEDIAGITVRGMAELPGIDQFDPPYPIKRRGPDESEWKLPVVEVAAPGANVVKRNSKTQIVEYCARSYGSGLVAFTPFSLSDRFLQDWPGRTIIPLGLLNKERNLFSIETDRELEDAAPAQTFNGWGNFQSNIRPIENRTLATFRNKLDNSFENDTPVAMQSPTTVLRFLLLYLLCAVPLNFAVFTILKRREAAWLATPLLALGFTIGAFYASYSGNVGVTAANEVTILEAGPGQGEAVGRTFMGVYAPRRDYYHLSFPPQKNARGGLFDVKAAPGHLVSQEKFEKRGIEFPKMDVLDLGSRLDIEQVLIQQRSTRHFEIQHRALLGDGVELKAAAGVSATEISVTNNTGAALINPIFFKNDQFISLKPGTPGAPNSRAAGFEPGEVFDSSVTPVPWRSGRAQAFDELARGLPERGKHVADRARALTDFMEAHSRQYAAGVFLAWIDGAALPVLVAPAGSREFATPMVEGITLLVVPVAVSNRGSKFGKAAFVAPRVEFANAYNPEVSQSGEWKPLNGRVPFDAYDNEGRRCLYLRLRFEDSFSRAYYESKQTRLTITVGHANNNDLEKMFYNLRVDVHVRDESAAGPRTRFKPIDKSGTSSSMPPKQGVVFKNIYDVFFKHFEKGSMILKLVPATITGTAANETDLSKYTLDGFKLELIDQDKNK